MQSVDIHILVVNLYLFVCVHVHFLFSGKVALGKVNFDAKTEYEYVANYKVLQSVFDSQQITKHVDVARLVKGKFQDNLEMLQWIKHFFDTHYGGQPYNARERREEAKAQYKKGHKHAGTGIKRPDGDAAAASSAAVDSSPAKPAVAATSAPRPAATGAPKSTGSAGPARSTAGRVAVAKPAPTRAAGGGKKNPASNNTSSGDDAAELNNQLSKLTITIEGLEKERNFYFGKLREIEILVQEPDASDADAVAAAAAEHPEVQEFKKKVLAILYATDENAEFQAPDDTTTAAPEENQADAGEGLLASDELQTE
jgi:RP/EB family microtubule-associated protein